jgi:hypothetical protein
VLPLASTSGFVDAYYGDPAWTVRRSAGLEDLGKSLRAA